MISPRYQSDKVTLYCGDCREILPQLGKVDACITDPPYVLKHMDGGGFASARKFYAGGSLDGLDSFNLQEYKSVLSFSKQLVAFHSRDQIAEYAAFAMESFGNYDLHVWYKTNAIPFTKNTWKSDLEYIALAWSDKRHNDVDQHEKSKAWVDSICTDHSHPACKPVGLMCKYVKVITQNSVFDPFMGSGTTGVAALRLGRKFIGIEIDEKYYAIAEKRIRAEEDQFKLPLVTEPEPKEQELLP